MAQWVKNLTSGALQWDPWWPGQWVKGSGVAAVAAAAQIQSLAWELPYAVSMAIKKKKKKKKKKADRTKGKTRQLHNRD